ncbi:MAG: hypothetical protein IH861_14815, partial [Chloroflexi bacterium]|nr:hypothetical protein [Chloroflexota bacterium]
MDSLGLATAILAGTTDITATQDTVVSNIAVLDVTTPPPTTITSIAVSFVSASVEEGQTQQFNALATFSDDSTA